MLNYTHYHSAYKDRKAEEAATRIFRLRRNIGLKQSRRERATSVCGRPVELAVSLYPKRGWLQRHSLYPGGDSQGQWCGAVCLSAAGAVPAALFRKVSLQRWDGWTAAMASKNASVSPAEWQRDLNNGSLTRYMHQGTFFVEPGGHWALTKILLYIRNTFSPMNFW